MCFLARSGYEFYIFIDDSGIVFYTDVRFWHQRNLIADVVPAAPALIVRGAVLRVCKSATVRGQEAGLISEQHVGGSRAAPAHLRDSRGGGWMTMFAAAMNNILALWLRLKDRGSSVFGASTGLLPGTTHRDPGFRFARYARISAWQIVKALALVALTTIVYFAFDSSGLLNFVPVIYLIPVVVAATRWGALPAVVASIAGFLASDYFFYPPYYSLAVQDPQEIVDLLLFLIVALVTSNLAARLKTRGR
jgi:hypothetical protein